MMWPITENPTVDQTPSIEHDGLITKYLNRYCTYHFAQQLENIKNMMDQSSVRFLSNLYDRLDFVIVLYPCRDADFDESEAHLYYNQLTLFFLSH
jgi:hypothetical protein